MKFAEEMTLVVRSEVTDTFLGRVVLVDVSEAEGCSGDADVNACRKIAHGDWSINIIL